MTTSGFHRNDSGGQLRDKDRTRIRATNRQGALVLAGMLGLFACQLTPRMAAPAGANPPQRTAICMARPHCSFRYIGGPPVDMRRAAPEDLRNLGCGLTYQYYNGGGEGDLGGYGAFCPDTPTNRAVLHGRTKPLSTGYVGPYCEERREPSPVPKTPPPSVVANPSDAAAATPPEETCINVPVGQLFVFITVAVGPSCPSTCESYPVGAPL
jgi:hypothetical protein